MKDHLNNPVRPEVVQEEILVRLLKDYKEVHPCKDNCEKLLDPDAQCAFTFINTRTQALCVLHLCQLSI